MHQSSQSKDSGAIKVIKVKVSSYIAQYPVLRTAQSTLHFILILFPIAWGWCIFAFVVNDVRVVHWSLEYVAFYDVICIANYVITNEICEYRTQINRVLGYVRRYWNVCHFVFINKNSYISAQRTACLASVR